MQVKQMPGFINLRKCEGNYFHKYGNKSAVLEHRMLPYKKHPYLDLLIDYSWMKGTADLTASKV